MRFRPYSVPEFPTANYELHQGASWECLSVTGLPRPIVRAPNPAQGRGPSAPEPAAMPAPPEPVVTHTLRDRSIPIPPPSVVSRMIEGPTEAGFSFAIRAEAAHLFSDLACPRARGERHLALEEAAPGPLLSQLLSRLNQTAQTQTHLSGSATQENTEAQAELPPEENLNTGAELEIPGAIRIGSSDEASSPEAEAALANSIQPEEIQLLLRAFDELPKEESAAPPEASPLALEEPLYLAPLTQRSPKQTLVPEGIKQATSLVEELAEELMSSLSYPSEDELTNAELPPITKIDGNYFLEKNAAAIQLDTPSAELAGSFESGAFTSASLDSSFDTGPLPLDGFMSSLVEPLEAPPAQTNPPSHFDAFVSALSQVALSVGATRAAALIPKLMAGQAIDASGLSSEVKASLSSAHIAKEAGRELVPTPSFSANAEGWARLLQGSRCELAADQTLDQFATELLAALLPGQIEQAELKRQLRKRGVAAFGMARAA